MVSDKELELKSSTTWATTLQNGRPTPLTDSHNGFVCIVRRPLERLVRGIRMFPHGIVTRVSPFGAGGYGTRFFCAEGYGKGDARDVWLELSWCGSSPVSKGGEKGGEGPPDFRELQRQGIWVRSDSKSAVAKEIPEAYRDVSDGVDVMDHSGIAKKVAKLVSLAVIKG